MVEKESEGKGEEGKVTDKRKKWKERKESKKTERKR